MSDLNFWDYHSYGFILCMFFFPRLTMLFATATGSGWLYWVGWCLAPRLTVAILATGLFWHQNTVLVVFTWIWALSGETWEKNTTSRETNKFLRRIDRG